MPKNRDRVFKNLRRSNLLLLQGQSYFPSENKEDLLWQLQELETATIMRMKTLMCHRKMRRSSGKKQRKLRLHRKEKQRMKQTAVCQITILILQRSMIVLRMEMSQFQVHI